VMAAGQLHLCFLFTSTVNTSQKGKPMQPERRFAIAMPLNV
jgi:hypothetical protein